MEKGLMNNKTFLKILSVLAAFVLWFFVVSTEDPPRSAKIRDVEIFSGLNQTQLNEGMNIFSKSDDTLDFTVRGKRSLVTDDGNRYFAKLNLDNISQPGKYSVVPEISGPDGVEIKEFEPEFIEVYVDKYVTSLVPVKVVQKNNLADGLVVSGMETAQSQVTVTLPSLALEEIAYVGLEVDMSTVKENCTLVCPVTYYNSNNDRIDVTNALHIDGIAVTITLEQHKTVPVNTDMRVNGEIPDDCELLPSPTEIEIYGDSEMVNSVTSLSTQPIVFDSAPEVGEEFKVKIILPEGVHLKEGTSDTVKITMKNKNG